MGFFNETTLALSKATVSRIPKCGVCGLYKASWCKSPKMPLSGKGKRKILICGEAPGKTENDEGKPFVGDAGKKLQDHLTAVGIDMRRDCWVTNALICWVGPGNKIPKPEHKFIEYCRPNLFNTIAELQPDVIIPLGGTAVKSLVGHVWKEDVGPVSRWVGFQIPSQKPNAWICPTYHPSYLLRQNDPVLELHFRRHLKAAVKLTGKPWDKLPDYEKQVQAIISPEEAAKALQRLIVSQPKLVGIDLETTTLKCDGEKARIVCCAVSDGKTTLAYPWHSPATSMTKQLLDDADISKVSHNLKFEFNWLRKEFGNAGRNWAWDSMVTAHVLDNREGITGLKFQSFVHFGALSYNDHIEPYLRARGGNVENNVRKVDLEELCQYCGVDAKFCVMLAKKQMGELGQ